MKLLKKVIMYYIIALLTTIAVFALVAPTCYASDGLPPKHKLIIQVSDADPAKWNLALNNAGNAFEEMRGDVAIEIVAYGGGVEMLKKGSTVTDKIEGLKMHDDFYIVACGNSVRAKGLNVSDMLPDTDYVPAGVVEIMLREESGYAYIRP